MPREILHHKGQFLMWSSVCDGPGSKLMTEPECREHLLGEKSLLPYQQAVMRHPSWGPLALADLEADNESERASIERRIARAKRNGASGLRWYDERYEGELWQDGREPDGVRVYTVAEIFAALEDDSA